MAASLTQLQLTWAPLRNGAVQDENSSTDMAHPRTAQTAPSRSKQLCEYFTTDRGTIFLGDSLRLFEERVSPKTVDLIVTSPPFGLLRKKTYGNADADAYLAWFRPFGEAFKIALKDGGSLVIDIGGAWIPGQPTRSLYHYELLIMLCRELGFHLAQDFFWWNPSKLPTPAEWVTVRRVRVKDAVNCIWWLSPTPWPKASNRRVPAPYSDAMLELLRHGYRAKKRPSGHDISNKFSTDNGAAIPPNLIALPNTESNSYYLRYCAKHGLTPHPARYPAELPEYFIRMLTDKHDLVVDPFAGSCVTGEVAQRLGRRWICCELVEDFLKGAVGRFDRSQELEQVELSNSGLKVRKPISYNIYHPAAMWNGASPPKLPADGGKRRPGGTRE